MSMDFKHYHYSVALTCCDCFFEFNLAACIEHCGFDEEKPLIVHRALWIFMKKGHSSCIEYRGLMVVNLVAE